MIVFFTWGFVLSGYILLCAYQCTRYCCHVWHLLFNGRFAAALNDQKMNTWVMNVVPVSGPNTLPVIYDRGLIGVAHDWYYLVTLLLF